MQGLMLSLQWLCLTPSTAFYGYGARNESSKLQLEGEALKIVNDPARRLWSPCCEHAWKQKIVTVIKFGVIVYLLSCCVSNTTVCLSYVTNFANVSSHF